MRSATVHTISLAIVSLLAAVTLAFTGASEARADLLLSPFPHNLAAHANAAQAGWYHDPVSPADRRAEVPVPSDPGAVEGPLRSTVATYRAANGAIAVPVSWAFGHQLSISQALVLNNSGLFPFNSPTPTAAAREDVAELSGALEDVRAVRCEGYTDFGGSSANEQRLSRQRAGAICALIVAQNRAIRTQAVGYAGTRPVIIGGSQPERAANRRVIVEVTATIEPPEAPRSLSVLAANSGADLSFRAPARDGGSPVSGYEYSLDGGAHWSALSTRRAGGLHATLAGLANGHAYTVLVRARNAAGASPPSSSAPFTPAPTPAAGNTGSGSGSGSSTGSGSSAGSTSTTGSGAGSSGSGSGGSGASEDLATPPEVQRRRARAGTRLVEFGAGHHPFLSRPREFAQSIVAAIDRS